MSTRVYIPSTIGRLRELLVSGGLGPTPVHAHAVTREAVAVLADADEEEQEYAVLTAAAQDSLGLLSTEERPRRVVVVAEADTVVESDGEGSRVELHEVVPLRRVVAVHVDSEEAEADVAAARDAWVDSRSGDEAAQRLVDRCEEHELGWFATQETAALVELT